MRYVLYVNGEKILATNDWEYLNAVALEMMTEYGDESVAMYDAKLREWLC